MNSNVLSGSKNSVVFQDGGRHVGMRQKFKIVNSLRFHKRNQHVFHTRVSIFSTEEVQILRSWPWPPWWPEVIGSDIEGAPPDRELPNEVSYVPIGRKRRPAELVIYLTHRKVVFSRWLPPWLSDHIGSFILIASYTWYGSNSTGMLKIGSRVFILELIPI